MPGETIHSYYWRYAKFINDININGMTMKKIQVNMKFVNHFQPEWSRFVTAAKQAKDLHSVNFAPSYQPIIQSPPQLSYDPRVVPQQQPAQSTQLDSGFVVPSFLPTDDQIASLNKAMLFLSAAMNSKFPPTNNQFRTSSNLKTQAIVQDGRAQEAGVILHEDQKDFLADRLEEMDDYDDLQLHNTSNFKADHVDAYDSDCDDEATACAIFMASLSLAGSINGDTTGPSYDSKLLSKIPHYETYHEDAILNDVVQEMEYNDHVVFNDNSCDELTSNSNIISYADYMVTIENDAAQYVHPLEQDKNAMI
ncbi:hypothetical protein Tco_1323459, partial [Tanacetum coccineum]